MMIGVMRRSVVTDGEWYLRWIHATPSPEAVSATDSEARLAVADAAAAAEVVAAEIERGVGKIATRKWTRKNWTQS